MMISILMQLNLLKILQGRDEKYMNVVSLGKHDKDYIWLLSNEINALLKCEISTGRISVEKYFDEKETFSSLIEVAGKVYLAPDRGEKFIVYDVREKNYKTVNPEENLSDIKIKKFGKAYVYEAEVIFLGIGYHGVAIINIYTNKVKLYSLDKRYIKKDSVRYLGREGVIKNQMLYVPIFNSGTVILFDLMSKKICYKMTGDESYASMAAVGDKYYLTPVNNSKITILDEKMNIINSLDISECDGAFQIYGGYVSNNILAFMPMNSKKIIGYNVLADGSSILDCEKNLEYFPYYSYIDEYDGVILASSNKRQVIDIWETEDLSVETKILKPQKELIEIKLNIDGILNESKEFEIGNYIEFLLE